MSDVVVDREKDELLARIATLEAERDRLKATLEAIKRRFTGGAVPKTVLVCPDTGPNWLGRK